MSSAIWPTSRSTRVFECDAAIEYAGDRGAPRVSRGAPSVGGCGGPSLGPPREQMSTPVVEERIEERHGFPEALRASGGVSGQVGARHLVSRLAALGVSRPATVGLTIILIWFVLALLAPAIAPYSPNASDVAALAHPTPSRMH